MVYQLHRLFIHKMLKGIRFILFLLLYLLCVITTFFMLRMYLDSISNDVHSDTESTEGTVLSATKLDIITYEVYVEYTVDNVKYQDTFEYESIFSPDKNIKVFYSDQNLALDCCFADTHPVLLFILSLVCPPFFLLSTMFILFESDLENEAEKAKINSKENVYA